MQPWRFSVSFNWIL